jgi:parallel beta-helix repeat protein
VRLILLLIAIFGRLAASEWYVAPNGDDAQVGSLDAPYRTLQKAVNDAEAGDTVFLRAGEYREEVVMRAKRGTEVAPIVIAAFSDERPVLKGSQTVAGWERDHDQVWRKSGWTSDSQQVFADGVALKQVGMPALYEKLQIDGRPVYEAFGAGVGDLVASSFFYDAKTQTLYAWLSDGGDPNTHVMEASTARRILHMDGNCAFIHLKNLSFMHSNASAHDAIGAAVELGASCRMEGCSVTWCDFAGVTLGWKLDGDALVDCTFSHNGAIGVQGSAHTRFLLKKCVVADNNQRGFSPIWHAGGMKFTDNAYGNVAECAVTGNRGVGIWYDYCSSDSISSIVSNAVTDTAGGAGIMVEASANVLVSHNMVERNAVRGIYVSASDGVRLQHNRVSGTTGVAAIEIGGMPREGRSLSHIAVFNNVLTGNASSDDLRIVEENGYDIFDIQCDDNRYWRTGGLALWYGVDGRGAWRGERHATLEAWQKATPFDQKSVCGEEDEKKN